MAVAPVCLESVIIDVVSSTSAQNLKVNGIIQETAGKSLTLVTDDEIPVSSDVALQSKDLIFLGEVLSCVPERGAKWMTQVRIRRSLLVV